MQDSVLEALACNKQADAGAQPADWMRKAAESAIKYVADQFASAMLSAGIPFERTAPKEEEIEAIVAILARHRDAEVERLREALSTIALNARLIPDPHTGGATDTYAVPFDDIDAANEILSSVAAPARPDASELVEALRSYDAAAAMPTIGDYSGHESATYTYEKSYGGGECSKHGRYYGSCASCRFDFDRYCAQKDREARYARDNKLREAGERARTALANWEAGEGKPASPASQAHTPPQ